ncbi:MAG: radical SAM protein, partial [Candidatus Helarchaeales archaeon]
NEILNCSMDDFLIHQEEAFQLRLKKFGKILWCFSPSMIYYGIDQHPTQEKEKFISVSVTGNTCQLNCEHCKGQILHSMHHARTPERLLQLARSVHEIGCENMLISGGSDKAGSVPLMNFIDVIEQIKKDLKMHVFIHTGLISEEFAKEISRVNVDNLMFDVIGDESTIHEVCHLERSVSDFVNSMRLAEKYGIPFVPHVILGLHFGKFKGELEALKSIARFHPKALVLVIIKPLMGTPMEKIKPPTTERVARVFTITRMGFPNIPITLGCARPIGDYRVESDIQAINSGINGIAFLSQDGADHAEKKGLQLKFLDTCCSLI